MPLTPRLPFDVDETPTSWAARLAALHTGGGAAGFLQDIGSDPRALADGDPSALQALAAAGGADPTALARNAVQRLAGDIVRCRGEVFDRRFVRRRRRVCPRCLVEDSGNAATPDPWRLRVRLAWTLSVVATCPKHGVRLLDFAGGEPGRDAVSSLGDGSAWRRIRRAALEAEEGLPCPLQRYALDRLEGVAGPPWLDGQRLDLAVGACAMLGAVALRGARPRTAGFGEEDRAEAHALGFAIAAEGEPAIRRLLSDLQARCPTADGHARAQAMFGALHEWAARAERDRGPLAAILRRHIVETTPVGPGDVVLGAAVEERRIHSVRTLGLATGLDPRRLRKLLIARGLITPEASALPDNRATFDAGVGETAARALVESVSLAALPARLGVNRTVARGLVAAGILAPILTPDAAHALGEHRFAQADVDASLDRALAGAAEVESAPPGFGKLRRAAAAAGVSVAEVLRAVLDGRIGELCRLGGEPGLSGLLVPLAATRAVFDPDPETRDVATYRAARLLRTTTRVIAALIADREDGPILPSRSAPNNRSAAARAIPRAALEAFHRNHIGLIALSRERDLHHLALAARLRARGIPPAFDPAAVKATFYRRAEIPADL